MKRTLFVLLSFGGLAIVQAQDIAPRRSALLNINNLTSWIRADGISNRTPKDNPGSQFPRGTATVVYQDGILWGGKAYVDPNHSAPAPFDQLVRVGGATYRTSTRPGRIIGFGATAVAADSNEAAARVYRIRRDYFEMSTAELRCDAAEYFEEDPASITAAQMQTVRAQYEQDWKEWPTAFGAPFIDRNRNGHYDPPPPFGESFSSDELVSGHFDEPGIASMDLNKPADQVLWTVYNDLDTTLRSQRWGSEPLGLEVQITQWAYKSQLAWGGYFYRRVRLINKGGVALNANGDKGAFWIDNMYLCQWSDPDLGYVSDDLVGCDTLLSLGYVYNGLGKDAEFAKFNLLPPALGYSLMQGPRVPAPGATAYFDMREISGWKNLAMTSFAYQRPGDAYSEPGANSNYRLGTLGMYNLLRSFVPIPGVEIYYPFPPGMKPGPFPFAGDPVRHSGYVDGYFGGSAQLDLGDRRLQINSGPFALAPGDTQEAVIACIGGSGSDRLSSVSVMKYLTKCVRQAFPSSALAIEPAPAAPAAPQPPSYYSLSPGFPNPFAGSTSFAYTVPKAEQIHLAIFDLLGREIAVLEDRALPAGEYRARWNGRDQNDRTLPSGVYFCRLQAAGYVEITHKVVLVKN